MSQKIPLHAHVETAIRDYLDNLNGENPAEMYRMVLSEVERPLLMTILEYTRGNQSKAAEMLGMNRGTLRTKLRTYSLNR